MFSALRQNSPFYILEQTGNFNLKIGQVASVSSPQYVGLNQFVDVTIIVDNEHLEFKQLPSALSIASKDGVVVSESQEAMFNEVANIVNNSEKIISEDNINYHRSIVEAGKPMLAKLSPKYAKEQENEGKLNNLENKVLGIENKLDNILDLLSKH